MWKVPHSLASCVSGVFHHSAVVLPLFAVALTVAACGGESSSPSAPTPVASPPPATPTVSAMRIDGPDAIRTGASATYTATVTLSNGTSQTVTPTWSSSNTSVASVNAGGSVSAQSHGTTTLSATYEGASASKPLSSVANFGGQWSGRYVMKSCDQSGAFLAVGYCQGFGGVGATGPITLSLSQGGSDLSQLSGTIAFGSLAGNITGNVTSDGRMVIGGAFNVTSSGVTFTFRVGGWESRLTGTSSMSGRWADNLTAVGIPGNAYTENELQTMTRTSTAEVPSSAPASVTMEWKDFFAAMRRSR